MFSVKINEQLIFSRDYCDLTDRDKSVFLTVIASMQPGFAFLKDVEFHARSKIAPSVQRLAEAGFLELDDGKITLAPKWVVRDKSALRVAKSREKKKAQLLKPSTEVALAPQHAAPIAVSVKPAEVAEEFDAIFAVSPVAAGSDDGFDDWDSEWEVMPASSSNQIVQKSSKAPREPAPQIQIPDWMPAQTWSDWLAHRKAIKKPMSNQAKNLFLNLCASLRSRNYDIFTMMNASIINSWPTIYDPEDPASKSRSAAKVTPQAAQLKRTGGLAL